MKFASVPTFAEQQKFILGKSMHFTVNTELEIVLATEKEFQELPALELVRLFPYSFSVTVKEKNGNLQFICKVSKSFKRAYGQYAHLETMLMFVKLWMRT